MSPTQSYAAHQTMQPRMLRLFGHVVLDWSKSYVPESQRTYWRWELRLPRQSGIPPKVLMYLERRHQSTQTSYQLELYVPTTQQPYFTKRVITYSHPSSRMSRRRSVLRLLGNIRNTRSSKMLIRQLQHLESLKGILKSPLT